MVTRRVAGARRANPQIPPNRQLHRYNENAPEMAPRGVPCTCASTRLRVYASTRLAFCTSHPRYGWRPPPPARYGAGQSMWNVPRHLEQPASTTGCTNGSRWVQWGHTPYDWPHAAAAPATSLGRSTIVQRSGRTLTNSRYSQRTVTGWWSTSRITWPPVARITRYHAPRRSPRWRSVFRRAHDSSGITASPSTRGTSRIPHDCEACHARRVSPVANPG